MFALFKSIEEKAYTNDYNVMIAYDIYTVCENNDYVTLIMVNTRHYEMYQYKIILYTVLLLMS